MEFNVTEHFQGLEKTLSAASTPYAQGTAYFTTGHMGAPMWVRLEEYATKARMPRRHFLQSVCGFAGALLAVPLAAAAQPPGQVYRIGFLSTNPLPAPVWDALLDGLRERGYIEGQNLVFERRFSEGNAERFPELAAELVRLRVDLILVPTTPAALAAKNATQTIPIVIPSAIDPVGAG